MVCTVVLSVVQDRHGYEVWISRSRHVAAVAALCLITIFVIFCHETDSGEPVPEIGPRSRSRPVDSSSRLSNFRAKLFDEQVCVIYNLYTVPIKINIESNTKIFTHSF